MSEINLGLHQLKIERQAQLYTQRTNLMRTLELIKGEPFSLAIIDRDTDTWELVSTRPEFEISAIEAENECRNILQARLQSKLTGIEQEIRSLETAHETFLKEAFPATSAPKSGEDDKGGA